MNELYFSMRSVCEGQCQVTLEEIAERKMRRTGIPPNNFWDPDRWFPPFDFFPDLCMVKE